MAARNHDERLHDRKFVRTFFTSPTAVEGEEDSAKMIRSASGLRETGPQG